NLIAIQNVTDEDGLMIINKSGVAIRMSMNEMRVMGRNTQGVKVINLKGNDSIAAIAKVEMDKEVEIVEEEAEGAKPAEVHSDLVEFSGTPQTGDNAISNMGDEKTLRKIEDEEASQNEKSDEDISEDEE